MKKNIVSLVLVTIVLFVLVNIVSLVLFSFFSIGTVFTDIVLNLVPFAYLVFNGFHLVKEMM